MNKKAQQSQLRATVITTENSATATASEKQNLFVAVTLIYAAAGLTALEYFGRPEFVNVAYPKLHESYYGLYSHLWWAACSIVVYLPLPLLIVKFGFHHSLRDYGLALKLNRRDLPIYAAMLLAVLPIVWFASQRAGFLEIYPFFRN